MADELFIDRVQEIADVLGPTGSIDNSMTLFSGTDGKLLKESSGTISLPKEISHTISVVASTTPATAGGNLTISSGNGNGAASGNLFIRSANETSTDASGAVSITSGSAATANSGNSLFKTGNVSTGNSGLITIETGASSILGNSGLLELNTGATTEGNSGNLSVFTGNTSSVGNSGDINIFTGAAADNPGSINLTGGDGSSTSGDITFTTGYPGIVATRGIPVRKIAAPTTKTTTVTLSTAEITSGWILANQGAGASAVYTTPTGTEIDTIFVNNNLLIEDSFDFTIINISTNASEDVTIAGGVGVTIVGSDAVQSNDAATSKSTGTWRFLKTAANTFTAYRIA